MNRTSSITTISLLLVVLITGADLLSFVGISEVSIIGVYAWFLSYLILLGFTAQALVFLLGRFFRAQAIWTVLTLALSIAKILYETTSPLNLSGETTQQIACVFAKIQHSNNFAFLDNCFFEYPLRQYYPAVFTSWLFGKTQFGLHLGACLYFIVGATIFCAGLHKYYASRKYIDALCALLLTLPFQSYHFNQFMLLYEQSVYPLCLAMLLCGVFFWHIAQPGKFSLGLFCLGAVYAVHAYTPSLALVLLALAVLTCLFFEKQTAAAPHKSLVLLGAFCICAELALSFSARADLKIIAPEMEAAKLWAYFSSCLEHFFFGNQGPVLFSLSSYAIYIALALLGLSLQFGWRVFFVSLWACSVLLLSSFLRGHMYYGPDFTLHRINVALPVLWAMLAYFVGLIKAPELKISRTILVLFVFFAASGISYHQNFLAQKKPSRYLAFIQQLSPKLLEQIGPHSKAHVLVWRSIDQHFRSLNDAFQYFSPNFSASILEEDCRTHSQLGPKPGENVFVLLPSAATTEACPALAGRSLTKIASLAIATEPELSLLRADLALSRDSSG